MLFVDEADKSLSGVQSSGQTDSGVSARLFGSLLTWLSDHTSDVFVVMTASGRHDARYGKRLLDR